MKTLLMCKPDFFEVSYVINPWMDANIGKVNKTKAKQQWQQLHDTLSSRARIKLIDPKPGLPDMVFTANAGLVHQKEVIVSTFRHAERQGETAHYREYFHNFGFLLRDLEPGTVFEGAGDALFDSRGALWLGSGPRSDAHAQAEIAAALQVIIQAVELVDPRWYHLDTAFCPLADDYALIYEKAFTQDSVALIRQQFGDKAIWISEEDALNFACNAVCLDHDIVLYRASPTLQKQLYQCGFNVIEIDVSEFMKSGGSCKCMTLEI